MNIQKHLNTATWLALVIYMVGLTGFLIPELTPWMMRLTPVNIMLALAAALTFHKKWTPAFGGAALIIALGGYCVEVAGVHTGVVFGHYHYGPTLGFSVWGVPLILAVNWFFLVYATRSLAQSWLKDPLLLSLLAAALMTGYDFILEPVAVRYHFWSWDQGIIPAQNYLAWFIISFMFHYIFLKWVPMNPNSFAPRLLLIQAVFFAVLHVQAGGAIAGWFR
jgi:putative membrane protein